MRRTRPPNRPYARSAAFLTLALVAFVLPFAAGCGDSGGSAGLYLPGAADRSPATCGNYLRSLAGEIATDLTESRALGKLNFLERSPLRDVYVRRLAALFDRVNGLAFDPAGIQTGFDGTRHLLRFTLHATGSLAGSLLEFEAEFPMEWYFTMEGDRLTLVEDGLARFTQVDGLARTADGEPLDGVAVRLDGRVVATSDDDGRFFLFAPPAPEKSAANRVELVFSRPGFVEARVPLPAGTREVRLSGVALKPQEGFFLPPVSKLRATPGDAEVRLRWQYGEPADRFVLLRRPADGPYETIAELPAAASDYVDRKDLVNGRRYFYRLQPFLGGQTSFARPAALAIPSQEIHRIAAAELPEVAGRLKTKGRAPWVVRTEDFFRDAYLAFDPARTATLTILTEEEFSAGYFSLQVHVRRDEKGGRFRLEVAQFGDPDPDGIASFDIDTRAGTAHRASLDLGLVRVRPIDWQSNPIPKSSYTLVLRSVPLDAEERVILIDQLEFIKVN